MGQHRDPSLVAGTLQEVATSFTTLVIGGSEPLCKPTCAASNDIPNLDPHAFVHGRFNNTMPQYRTEPFPRRHEPCSKVLLDTVPQQTAPQAQERKGTIPCLRPYTPRPSAGHYCIAYTPTPARRKTISLVSTFQKLNNRRRTSQWQKLRQRQWKWQRRKWQRRRH